MKALLKIGFVAAFCLAGNAAFGQTPAPQIPLPANANVKTAPAPPEKKTEAAPTQQSNPDKKNNRQKVTPPASQREKKVEPAKKEEIR